MRLVTKKSMILSAFLLLVLTTSGAWASESGSSDLSISEPVDESRPLVLAQAEKASNESINVKLHDLELVDEDGKRLKFKSEVIGDRVAVIVPFYTTCTTNYPILIFTFTRLQQLLGERMGKDVVLVSVSVDPRTDIPIRLKAFAKRNNAKPGWKFLSGDRNNLGQVLWGVGVIFSSNLEEHNHIPITMVGSAGGEWRRLHGFPSPEQVLNQVEEMLAARRTSEKG
jgi:protein SCO1